MTDPNTEAMELWREVHQAPTPLQGAAIIAAKLAELRARIEGLEGALRDVDERLEEQCFPKGGPTRLTISDALEADHGA